MIDIKALKLFSKIEFPDDFKTRFGPVPKLSALACLRYDRFSSTKKIETRAALQLRDLPMEQWPKTPWVWCGLTRKRRMTGNRWYNAQALTLWQGKRVNPARVLHEFYTGTPPPPGNRFHHKSRKSAGGRERKYGAGWTLEWVDVNPANYVCLDLHPARPVSRKNKPQAVKPDDLLARAITERYLETNQMPKTIDDLGRMGFDIEGISLEVLEATLAL